MVVGEHELGLSAVAKRHHLVADVAAGLWRQAWVWRGRSVVLGRTEMRAEVEVGEEGCVFAAVQGAAYEWQ